MLSLFLRVSAIFYDISVLDVSESKWRRGRQPPSTYW